MLFDLGETSLSIAGIVIAGFAIGGLFYTLTVSRFLPWLGVKGMMIAGAALVGLQLARSPSARLEAAVASMLLMGWGFYMIHGCLQVFASELSVGGAGHRDVAAFVLLLHGADRRPDRLWPWAPAWRQVPTLLASAAIMIVLGLRLRPAAQAARAADARSSRALFEL